MQGKLKYGIVLTIGILATVALTGLAKKNDNHSEIREIQNSLRVDGLVAQAIRDYHFKGESEAIKGYAGRGYQVSDNMVRVVIEGNNDGSVSPTLITQSIQNSVTYWGGRIESNYGRLHRVLLPVQAIQDISHNPCVSIIRTPIQPFEAGVTSEGVARSGADLFQSAPSFGGDTEVKIAILDSGFKGYNNLLGSELPSSVVTKNFRGDGDFESSAHGAACAEIVYDMMPSAFIYLVAVNDDVGFHQAVDWLIDEKVDVISSSLVWLCDAGAGDGTGPICEDVKKADEAGILWAQACGNFADCYFGGQYYEFPWDPNWHNSFGGKGGGKHLAFKATGPVSIYLSWDDWGTWDGQKYSGSNQDYGLYVYPCRIAYNDHYEFDTALSGAFDTPQNGTEPWNVPVEKSGWYSPPDPYNTDIFGVSIRRNNSNRDVKFRIYILGAVEPIDRHMSFGSLGIPADSTHAVSVVGVSPNDVLYPLNSTGPTQATGYDQLKPELTGYSSISTLSMGTFEGTSAAAAHVAGALGLLKSKLPYKPDDLKQVLIKRAIPLGPVGSLKFDYPFGYGRLNLLKK